MSHMHSRAKNCTLKADLVHMKGSCWQKRISLSRWSVGWEQLENKRLWEEIEKTSMHMEEMVKEMSKLSKSASHNCYHSGSSLSCRFPIVDYSVKLLLIVLLLMHRLAPILCSSSYQMSIVQDDSKSQKLDRSVQNSNMALKVGCNIKLSNIHSSLELLLFHFKVNQFSVCELL